MADFREHYTYAVHPNGHLELMGSVKRRGGASPDTKDLAISSDGKWLYAVSSTDRKINVFRVGAGDQTTELSTYQSPAPVSSGQHITGLVADESPSTTDPTSRTRWETTGFYLFRATAGPCYAITTRGGCTQA